MYRRSNPTASHVRPRKVGKSDGRTQVRINQPADWPTWFEPLIEDYTRQLPSLRSVRFPDVPELEWPTAFQRLSRPTRTREFRIKFGRLCADYIDTLAQARLANCTRTLFARHGDALLKAIQDDEILMAHLAKLAEDPALRARVEKLDDPSIADVFSVLPKGDLVDRYRNICEGYWRTIEAWVRLLGRILGSPVLSDFTLIENTALEGLSESTVMQMAHAVPLWWSRCEVEFRNGALTVREPRVQRKGYNPEGISLLCVMHEILVAREVHWSIPPYVRAQACQIETHADLARSDSARMGYLTLLDEHLIALAGSSLVSPCLDDNHVSYIQKYPSALLISPEHQAAVARWHYASRWGTPDERDYSDSALRKCVGLTGKAGRPPSARFDTLQLRQAHRDLCDYVTGLKRAMRDSQNQDMQDVRAQFPDCDFLLLNPKTGKGLDAVQSHFRKRQTLDKPDSVAVNFIVHHTNLSRSTVYKLLKSET